MCVHFRGVTYFSSAHFVHIFPPLPTVFLVFMFTDMFIMNTHVDNEMYYFIIICLGDDSHDGFKVRVGLAHYGLK